ncbi:MAG: hypothetical protein ACT4OM_08480 [Actinomycetota bacterium]
MIIATMNAGGASSGGFGDWGTGILYALVFILLVVPCSLLAGPWVAAHLTGDTNSTRVFRLVSGEVLGLLAPLFCLLATYYSLSRVFSGGDGFGRAGTALGVALPVLLVFSAGFGATLAENGYRRLNYPPPQNRLGVKLNGIGALVAMAPSVLLAIFMATVSIGRVEPFSRELDFQLLVPTEFPEGFTEEVSIVAFSDQSGTYAQIQLRDGRPQLPPEEISLGRGLYIYERDLANARKPEAPTPCQFIAGLFHNTSDACITMVSPGGNSVHHVSRDGDGGAVVLFELTSVYISYQNLGIDEVVRIVDSMGAPEASVEKNLEILDDLGEPGRPRLLY